MGKPLPGIQPPQKDSEKRLDSWKEIAAYLGRDVTTAQRWEKREGMPVHRHVHDKRGSVYALAAELDVWRQSRKLRLEEEKEAEAEGWAAHENEAAETAPPAPRWLAVAGTALLALLVIGYVAFRGRTDHAARPKIMSVGVLPLANLSGDPEQEYLADGRDSSSSPL
jgi:hypothetical protein